MKKIIAFILSLALIVSMFPSAYADGYSCSTYDDCTKNGDIYIITKDNCPIREEPSENGAIAFRGKVNELISIKRVFRTVKLTTWGEINANGYDKPLYIYMGNCEEHRTHTMIPLASTENGYLQFCAVCGYCEGESASGKVSCDATCILDHAVKGDFSREESSLMSIAAEVLVGEIPGVGSVADLRDLIGSVITGESWGVVLMNAVGLVPFIGALKYSDELATVGKHTDDIAGIAKHSADVPWGKWDDYEKVVINGKEYAKIGSFKYSDHAVSEFLNPSIETGFIRKEGFSYDKPWAGMVEHSRGVPPSYVEWMLTEGRREGFTKLVSTNGIRSTYVNGSLTVVTDTIDGNEIIVTIVTR